MWPRLVVAYALGVVIHLYTLSARRHKPRLLRTVPPVTQLPRRLLRHQQQP